MAASESPDLGTFQWDDPFYLETQLGEDERMLRDAAAGFAASNLAPRITDAYVNEVVAPEIFSEMGEAGLLGVTLPESLGGLGASYTARSTHRRSGGKLYRLWVDRA